MRDIDKILSTHLEVYDNDGYCLTVEDVIYKLLTGHYYKGAFTSYELTLLKQYIIEEFDSFLQSENINKG